MIDITVSFFPQRIHNIRWANMSYKTLTTWQCNITQRSSNGACIDIIPFEYFPPKDVQEHLLTCEVHAPSWEEHDTVYKHTIDSALIHKDLVKAMDDAGKFMKDLKQFVKLWTDRYSPARFHSKIEIKDDNVSFAKGEDLVTF